MILYADIYIVINIFCDWLALWCCAKIIFFKVSRLRMLAASLFMSFFALLSVISGMRGAIYMAYCAGVMLVGCFIAYGRMPYMRFFRTVLVFFVCNIVTGGVVGWLSQMTIPNAAAAVLLTPFIHMAWSGIGKKLLNKSTSVNVSVNIDGRKLQGLVDSGNLATDPSSGLPVILANRSSVCDELPESFFLIEISTAVGKGILPCFCPDSIKIGKRDVSAVVALDESNALKYDCIVPSGLYK